ncbi:cytochrome C oxidase subunit II [Paenibacillus sediminis]|uniref:Cytochrome c oxidase subunit 2 n=1 Tax=Paenibacillus sediminis TaxID=664909 RepID=A0ABS4H4S5_9BACL|nr:cytochrome C oxidase subunit II [Paenibacillus sediminis]MBP1937516.1 cytochrome c oxidase subunit 2 [Paenibacillus sediminis]
MKKSIALLISILLMSILAACGGGTNSADQEAENITAKDKLVIKATNYEFDKKEYHIKKDVPVQIVLENVSGNHGILVPGLKLQLDSKHSSKVIVPKQAGEYEMACSVFCGSGHTGMIAKIVVDE